MTKDDELAALVEELKQALIAWQVVTHQLGNVRGQLDRLRAEEQRVAQRIDAGYNRFCDYIKTQVGGHIPGAPLHGFGTHTTSEEWTEIRGHSG
jgi:hypothetical protein